MQNEGRTDVAAYLESRPVAAEVEAITRSGRMARETGCKLHVVHISSAQGVEAALEARAQGADISLETCPHYLLFWDDDMERIGALAKCAPPFREDSEKQALYSALFFGKIDIVASDHSPCPPLMKLRENFFEVWGGIAGVQWTLPTLIELRYHAPRIAYVTAEYPARRFGLAGRGGIEVGASADLAILDFEAKFTVREKDALHRHRISPYTGEELQGIVRSTVRRGEVIYSEGAITARTKGKFIRPERPASLKGMTGNSNA
jgi:allantoinase